MTELLTILWLLATTGSAAANLMELRISLPHTPFSGWQRTFEGYYEVETVKIINNYVEWLTNTPNARFIQVETSFLQRWWVDANATQRARFTALLQSKRLELVGGGWTMHGECARGGSLRRHSS